MSFEWIKSLCGAIRPLKSRRATSIDSTLRFEASTNTLDELAYSIKEARDAFLRLRVEGRHDDNGQKSRDKSYQIVHDVVVLVVYRFDRDIPHPQ